MTNVRKSKSEFRVLLIPASAFRFVLEEKLKKHLFKCNAAKIVSQSYYSLNLNSGIELSPAPNCPPQHIHGTPDICDLKADKIEAENRFCSKILQLTRDFNLMVSAQDETEIFEKCVVPNITSFSSASSLVAVKHKMQHEKLLELLPISELANQIQASFTSSSDSAAKQFVFVELGAGRAGFSHAVNEALLSEMIRSEIAASSREQQKEEDEEEEARKRALDKLSKSVTFLLIDRQAVRHRCDPKVAKQNGAAVRRIQIDIRHLNLAALLHSHVAGISRATTRCLFISKHLCGAATDLALRCLHNFSCRPTLPFHSSTAPPLLPPNNDDDVGDAESARICFESSEIKSELESALGRNWTLLIALCCHSKCDCVSYVATRDWLQQECRLSASEFEKMTRISSWATSFSKHGQQMHDDAEVTQSPVASEEFKKLRIGLACKALINEGRRRFLQRIWPNCRATVERYCDVLTTPENYCLRATFPDV